MIYKFDNGGIVKLQNAGSIPEYNDIEQIAKYNREHGTNFWKMSQVLEYDKQQAQQKTQDKKKSFWEILAGHPESVGEAILNKTIETANNAELPETRKKIYNDTAKSELGTTAGSLLTLPMLGELSTYGLLGGSARLAGGMAGSAVGSYTLGKAGELGDSTFGTTWMKPTGQIIGGFTSWVPGSNIAYKGALDLASVAPKIARIGTTKQFVGDVVGRALGKSIKNDDLTVGPLRHALKANLTPNHSNFGVSEYELFDTLTGKSIGKLGTTFDIRQNKIGIPHVDNIIGTEGTKGVSRSLYNAALIDNPSGLVSGESLVHPEITESVWKHFPYKVISNNGIRPNNTQGAIVDLNAAETFVPTLTENKIIPFTPTPQKPVSTVHFDPRVKPLSKSISEAERLGIPKSMRSNPKSLEDPYYWGYKQWNQRYFNALYSGNYPEVQRIRDLHFKTKAPNTKVVDENGNPLHMYHGIADRRIKRFLQYRGVNWDVERAVKAGDKRNHWKISEPTTDVMANYHTPNYKVASGSYGHGRDDLVYDDYLNITKPITWGEDIHNLLNSEHPGYSEKMLITIPAHHHVMTGELIPARQIVEYTGVPDWARFDGLARKTLMKHGYDGLYIPQYYDSYGAFISPSQFKSADPITWNKGEIIPIVKRDNFHNLDRRYKQGGVLKTQK